MAKNVLVIYNTSDEQWQQRVDPHLRLLSINNPVDIEYWNETFFSQSQEIDENLEPLLSRSSAIVLLMSEKFLNSDIMKSEKVRSRLKDKQKAGFPIFTLVLEKSEWKNKYRWMKNLSIFPLNDRQLSDLKEDERENIFANLASRVFDVLNIKQSIKEGILGCIELNGAGHIDALSFEPAKRLNIITGDNGFGKTLLLECIWWALSGNWPQLQVIPKKGFDKASIAFNLMQTDGKQSDKEHISFNFETQRWPENKRYPDLSGLVLYARVDGSFAIWDPVKGRLLPPIGFFVKGSPMVFTKSEILDGKSEITDEGRKRTIFNGLIHDWVNWQISSNRSFLLMKDIVEILTQSSGESFEICEPTEFPGDDRPMPSLKYPYGIVPILHSASSVQRIFSLAYLLAWLWTGHQTACEQTRVSSYRNIILLIDEAESHLHPKWQRSLVPSLLKIKEFFANNLDVQFIISTHSPLLMASLEPVFDEDSDSIFHFDMKESKIELNPLPFIRHGRVDHWFTSDLFELKSARSLEAENAIKEAIEILKSETPDKEKMKQTHTELCRVLGEFDSFWPRWTIFAKQNGLME